MDAQTQRLISAPPLPLLVQMATPNSIAFFIQSAVSMTEVWFIGRLGSASLAAIALVFPLLMLTQTMSGGAMGGAVASSIARAMGAGDQARAEGLMWHALLMSAGGAVLFLVLCVCFGLWFLALLGGQGLVLKEAFHYALILAAGGWSIWLLGVVSAIYRGVGNMQFPAVMMVGNACVQVPLSGCLILGVGDLVPGLGAPGAAISAVVAAAVVSAWMLFGLARGRERIRLRWSSCVLRRELFEDLLRVFAPASMSPLLTVLTIVCLTAIVGRFGEQALAGYGIGSRIEFLMVPLVFGLGAAMTSLVGMSVGAGNIERAERIGWTGGTCAFLLTAVTGAGLALTPNLWVPWFTDAPEVAEAAVLYIQIVGPCYGFFGLGLALYFASQGAGAMRWPVIATILRCVLAVSGALLLAFQFGLGLQGVYYAAAAGMVGYGAMIAAALKLGAWRRHDE